MEREADYVLKRLDEWYTHLFEKKYTSEVANELERRINKRLARTKTLEIALERNTFSDLHNKWIEDSKNFFSRNIVQEGESSRPTHSELAKRHYNIIELARKKSDEEFPNELIDEEIKNIYLDAMDGLKGLIELLQDGMRNFMANNRRSYLMQEIDEGELTYRNEYMQAMMDEIPLFYQKLFEN